MLKNKKVLVTGGAGFIGSHLVGRLVRSSCQVTVLDNLQAGKEQNLEQVKKEIEFVQGDVRDTVSVNKLVKQADLIFHIAANASVPHSVDNPRYDYETNALGSFNLLEAAKGSNIEKFVYASTAAVYGNPVYTPMDEKHPLNPVSPYGASKLSAETMGFAFQATYGLPFVAIRIFNTYGPRQPRYVIFDFIQKLRRNPKRLEVLGDGNQIRDYCHISDMVEAFMMVAEKGDGVYNAAGGKPTSIRELAELIVSMLAPDAEIVYGGKTWKGDIQALLADISRTRALGFNPKVDLKKGDWFADMLRYI